MKKSILFLASLLVLATSCYEDYVRDFDYSGAFIAYQYNLRTFVLDDEAKFKVTVALSGVMENDQDRNVELALESVVPEGSLEAFTNTKTPGVSGSYVSKEIAAAKLSQLTILPEDHFTVEGLDGLCIRKGSHTASVTLRATDVMRNDPNAFAPYYAMVFRIKSADVDQIIEGKDFSVIAVKCENRFYGTWSRSGKVVSYDAAGQEVSVDESEQSLADQYCYTLTTVNANTVNVDRVAGSSGQMTLTFDGDQIVVSSADGTVSGTGSFDGSKLLQNRKLYLNYTVTAADGSRKEVTDTLYFRNRTRDGVNEWQDENPENYN